MKAKNKHSNKQSIVSRFLQRRKRRINRIPESAMKLDLEDDKYVFGLMIGSILVGLIVLGLMM